MRENQLHRVVSIRGVYFPLIDYSDALRTFELWIQGGGAHQVCIVNVHTLVSATKDPEYKRIFCDAAMNAMDGQPLRWYANLVKHAGLKDRICGPELMVKCLQYGVEKNWKHYLLGGKDEVLASLQQKLVADIPGVRVVGVYSPPFRALTVEEEASIVEKINSVRPDFLWVGLGAPKQEQWIYRHLQETRVPVQLGVGAAFDFHAGAIKRAPEAMQKVGLEWLYRVYKDPRLWRRYMSTNPVFLYYLLWDWIASKYSVLWKKDS